MDARCTKLLHQGGHSPETALVRQTEDNLGYAEFEKLMDGQTVQVVRSSSALRLAMLAVYRKGSNVVGLYQVPYSWVAALMLLGNGACHKPTPEVQVCSQM